jgi:hypothetical protein
MNYITLKSTTYVLQEKKIPITLDMVDQLYEGKGNNCRCGCGGKYFQPDEHPAKIQRIINKMCSGKYNVTSIDDYIFEIILSTYEERDGREQTRVRTLYLKRNA